MIIKVSRKVNRNKGKRPTYIPKESITWLVYIKKYLIMINLLNKALLIILETKM